MSRHFFDCELHCSVRVRMGYDPELEGFFLEVERIGSDPRQGHSMYVYQSICDHFDRANDLHHYRKRLADLGIVVPNSLFQASKDDATNGPVNRCAQHFTDGRIVEPTEE